MRISLPANYLQTALDGANKFVTVHFRGPVQLRYPRAGASHWPVSTSKDQVGQLVDGMDGLIHLLHIMGSRGGYLAIVLPSLSSRNPSMFQTKAAVACQRFAPRTTLVERWGSVSYLGRHRLHGYVKGMGGVFLVSPRINPDAEVTENPGCDVTRVTLYLTTSRRMLMGKYVASFFEILCR